MLEKQNASKRWLLRQQSCKIKNKETESLKTNRRNAEMKCNENGITDSDAVNDRI